MVAANTVALLANFVLTRGRTYHVGDPVDGLYFLAWLFRWAAARGDRTTTGGTAIETVCAASCDTGAASCRTCSSLVRSSSCSASSWSATDTTTLAVAAASAAAMTAILLVRQMAEMTENDRLFSERLEQERRFRSLVQNSSDVVLVLGAGRACVLRQPRSGRRAGRGQPASRRRSAVRDRRPAKTRHCRGCWTRPRIPDRVQCRFRAADGTWREMEIVSSDQRDEPSVNGVVLNCRDVTERHELEWQLRHAQKLEAIGQLAGGLAHDFNNVLAVIRGYVELLKLDLPENAHSQEALSHLDQAVDRAAGVTRKLLAFSRRQPKRPVVIDLAGVLADLRADAAAVAAVQDRSGRELRAGPLAHQGRRGPGRAGAAEPRRERPRCDARRRAADRREPSTAAWRAPSRTPRRRSATTSRSRSPTRGRACRAE